MVLGLGGAGFIRSSFVLDWLAVHEEQLVNLVALTYAGNLENLVSLEGDVRHVSMLRDICDRAVVDALMARHRLRAHSPFCRRESCGSFDPCRLEAVSAGFRQADDLLSAPHRFRGGLFRHPSRLKLANRMNKNARPLGAYLQRAEAQRGPRPQHDHSEQLEI